MKIINHIKQYAWQILTVLFILLFLGRGCTSKKISKIDKKLDTTNVGIIKSIDSLENRINQLENTVTTPKQTQDIMERVMLDFLIYEDDLDRGKTSLSQIKNKIEKND